MSGDQIGLRWPLLAGAWSALSCIGTLLLLLLWPIWAPLVFLAHGLGWWPQRRSLTLEGETTWYWLGPAATPMRANL